MRKAFVFASVLVLWCACIPLSLGQTNVTIVAQRSFTGLTISLPPTTIFTPGKTGVFRVSGYVEASNVDGGVYGAALYLSWSGDFGSYQLQVGDTTAESGDAGAFPFDKTLHAKVGEPIQISTVSSVPGTYNVYVRVEKL